MISQIGGNYDEWRTGNGLSDYIECGQCQNESCGLCVEVDDLNEDGICIDCEADWIKCGECYKVKPRDGSAKDGGFIICAECQELNGREE